MFYLFSIILVIGYRCHFRFNLSNQRIEPTGQLALINIKKAENVDETHVCEIKSAKKVISPLP